MEEKKKKPRIGIALLNMVATFADRRDSDKVQEKQIEAFEGLESVAKSLNLDKILILGVSPEVIKTKGPKDNRIDIDIQSTYDDLWHLGNCIAYGEQIYYHILHSEEDDESIQLTPHLDYLGILCSNGFIATDPREFVKRNGKPVEWDWNTRWDFMSYPEQYEIDPDNKKTTFNFESHFVNRITIDPSIPRLNRGPALFKLTADRMIEYLERLAEEYDIKQVITCTDNSTYQEEFVNHHGINMLDSEQIAKACKAPVFTIINDIYKSPFVNEQDNIAPDILIQNNDGSLLPESDGFKGKCYSNDRFTFGFAKGMKHFTLYMNKTQATIPQRKDLQQIVGRQ